MKRVSGVHEFVEGESHVFIICGLVIVVVVGMIVVSIVITLFIRRLLVALNFLEAAAVR